MFSLLKYIELPHVRTYKSRWVRRIMIIVTLPQEMLRSVYNTFVGAISWWKQA